MLVYLIKNRVNGKEYVGQTTRSLAIRWAEHCRPSKVKKCLALHNAIIKYGPDAFDVSVLLEVENLDELNRAEAEQIALRKSLTPLGYNLTTGGRNHIFSKLSRQRRAHSMTGHRHSEASKQKMSKMRKGKLSEKQAEHLQQMQKRNIGSFRTPEWRDICSQRMQGNQNGRTKHKVRRSAAASKQAWDTRFLKTVAWG